MHYDRGYCGSLREERGEGRVVEGSIPKLAYELGMAESVFRESFLEKVILKLYLGQFLEFSENKTG